MAILHREKSIAHHVVAILFVLLGSSMLQAQSRIDSLLGKVDPQKWAAIIGERSEKLEASLLKKSNKTLDKLQQQEERIYKKLLKGKDSVMAKAKLDEMRQRYQTMKDKLNNPSQLEKGGGTYISKLDSLGTSLKFLSDEGVGGKVKDAMGKVQGLQDQFAAADKVKEFIKERRQQLKAQLAKLGMMKQLKKINKEVFYYSAQIQEYKEMLKDSKKLERKALTLLSQSKLFKDFMRKNSQLASLFRIPGDPSEPTSTAASLTGLQTRAQVGNLIQQQIAAGGPGAQQQFHDNIQSAQSQLNQLKDKVMKAGAGSSAGEIPDFKPRALRTKSFMQRLEYGSNFQTQRATSYFPTTTDIGLSLGYKASENSVFGIGLSYKAGLGRGWNDIAISHQGVGLRSYVDIKLKGSFWISGGYEQNHRAPFRSIAQLQDQNAWQQSGLLGLSKVLSVRSKFLKKTKIQLLWDFLSYNQIPFTSPILFRVGYLIK